MAVRVTNSVEISAPPELVWDISDDITNWPQLFDEYAGVEVVDDPPGGPQRLRLITHPDESGKTWSWTVERRVDRGRWTVESRRLESGPFVFLHTRWDFRPTARGTRVEWTYEFTMRPSAPIDDATMAGRIDENARMELAQFKVGVEKIAGVALTGQRLEGANGADVDFDAYRGRPLVVILGNRDTQKVGHQIVESLRSHPETLSVPVVQVAHLGDVPRPLHGMARRHIEAGYRGQLSDLALRRAAIGAPRVCEQELLNIGLDWSGAITGAFGFSAHDRKPIVLVIDPQGRIAARCVGAQAFPAVRAAIAALPAGSGGTRAPDSPAAPESAAAPGAAEAPGTDRPAA